MPLPISSLPHQHGAALFVSLIFLFLLTMLGVVGMSNSILQEKMAGNMRDRNLAFQAAESALRAGEEAVHNNDPILAGGVICTSASDGLYSAANPGADCPVIKGWPSSDQTANPYPPDETGFWKDNTDVLTVASSGLANLAVSPSYVIEELAPGAPAPAMSLEAGRPKQAALSTHYRITAYGRGMTNGSLVVMQSVVRY